MLETLLLAFVTGIAGLIAFLIIYARWHYGSLEKLGIPVAKPHFILGSDHEAHKFTYTDRDVERFRKFGSVFGVYEGRQPQVFVADPDMIKAIMVKDFDYFCDRSVPNWGHDIFSELLDFLPGEKWRTVRSALTPMFTSSRIRHGGNNFKDITEKYIKELKKEFKGDTMKFDMKEFIVQVFVEFASDYFLAIKLAGDGGNIKDNYIYKLVRKTMNDVNEQPPSIVYAVLTAFPFLIKVIPMFGNGETIQKFIVTLDQVVKARREAKRTSSSSGKDFIDVMVTMFDSLDSAEYKQLGIDKLTVQAQAFEMYIAGYDPIILTITILSYYLAENQEVQEKVLEELEEKGGDMSELPYLTACIKEALRLHPSFHHLERQCMKDWTYNENGMNLRIPKGMSVIIPAWATNRNPNVFKNPEEFRPERYYKEDMDSEYYIEQDQRAQFAMNTFGHGPRNCPGQRMGIEMIKAGLATMLKEFKFELRQDSKIKVTKGVPLIARYEPIYVNIVKRGVASEQ